MLGVNFESANRSLINKYLELVANESGLPYSAILGVYGQKKPHTCQIISEVMGTIAGRTGEVVYTEDSTKLYEQIWKRYGKQSPDKKLELAMGSDKPRLPPQREEALQKWLKCSVGI